MARNHVSFLKNRELLDSCEHFVHRHAKIGFHVVIFAVQVAIVMFCVNMLTEPYYSFPATHAAALVVLVKTLKFSSEEYVE